MKALSVAQMREADRRCIEGLGIPSAVLMENAGRAVFSEAGVGPVGVLCGKGNNGGDGFVVARLALSVGLDVRVVLVAEPDSIQGDAAIFKSAYERLGGRIVSSTEADFLSEEMAKLTDCSVVIDALLGTGIRGEVHGPVRAAIEAWPEVPTLSVDLPSGMNADTGEPCGCCVRANTTVTFQFMKKGFEAAGAKDYLGRLVVADIGIPRVCADDEAWARLMSS